MKYTFWMEGGCYCKAIRSRVNEEPAWVGACHCVDCRKISGASYTVWAGFKNKNFEVLSGTPKKLYSSKKVTRTFCENCGSQCTFIYTVPDVSEEDDLVYFPIGYFDNPEAFKLQQHIWVSQKLPWIELNDGLPQRER